MWCTMSTMNRTNIYLTDRQQKELAKQAAKAGISMAELIRRILDQALFDKAKG